MQRLALDSTTLAWARYFPHDRVLELGFRTGKVYVYSDVPLPTYQELVHAESKGRYFNLHIRNHFRAQAVHALTAGQPN
jgi:lysyl-tRNA synthetase class 2